MKFHLATHFLVSILSFLAGECFSQDQVLQWFTYFGDANTHSSRIHVALSPDGSVYTASEIETDQLIFGNNIHQDFYAGNRDAYLAKFSATGELLWCTNFGGPGLETCHDLEINSEGKPVIVGSTDSDTGIAFGESFQNERAGSGDDYIAVFETTGEISWSTYFGGENAEDNPKMALDDADNIVISGLTYSENLATSGAHQETISNITNTDAFIAQFNSAGSLNWCTYFGSEETEFTESIATDGQNNIIVALRSDSNEGLATENAYQTQSQNQSPVLAKFSPEGELLWSTYVSGESNEINSSIAVDGNDDIYLAGGTESMENIASENAFQEVNIPGEMWPGGVSNYIMKFNPSGSKEWGTYFGGSQLGIEVHGMVGMNDGLGFMRTSYSADDLIFGESPFQSTIAGETDGIIVRFSNEGFPLWSTAFGGDSFDNPIDMYWKDDGSFAITGFTRSDEFYASDNSWQSQIAGGLNDSFIALFQDNTLSQTNIFPENTELRVYPNPSENGKFQVGWNLGIPRWVDLIIYDLNGRQVARIDNYQEHTTINSTLLPGVYFVTAEFFGKIQSKKLILMR
jgi:hypothetical protein